MEDKRTESVFVYVTPEVKKEFDKARDDDKIKEQIIRNFLTSETEWLSQEIKEIDEYSIKYSAKLIGTKDAFAKSQESYIKEIEEIYSIASKSSNKINILIDKTDKKFTDLRDKYDKLNNYHGYFDVDRLEKLLNVVDRYNKMGESEKELIKHLIKE